MSRRLVGLIVLVAAGCADEPVHFRVVDLDGNLYSGTDVRCYTYAEGDGYRDADVSDLGDGTYLCHHAGRGFVGLDSRSGDFFATRYGVSPDVSGLQDVVMWQPAIEVEERDGMLELAWDPAPAVGAPWSGAPLRVELSGAALDMEVPATERGVAVPLELLEDIDVVMRLSVRDQGPADERLYREVDWRPVPHTATTPISRGLGCEVRRDGADIVYAAGECPVTDGYLYTGFCLVDCIYYAVLDLGAEVPVGRIRATATQDDARVQISLDAVTYSAVANGEVLAGRVARYVRVDMGHIGEVSVFAPMTP